MNRRQGVALASATRMVIAVQPNDRDSPVELYNPSILCPNAGAMCFEVNSK